MAFCPQSVHHSYRHPFMTFSSSIRHYYTTGADGFFSSRAAINGLFHFGVLAMTIFATTTRQELVFSAGVLFVCFCSWPTSTELLSRPIHHIAGIRRLFIPVFNLPPLQYTVGTDGFLSAHLSPLPSSR
ncbi:hypothetical protein M430DRAFT_163011 [Amorphotheca resinae ATCC 22711]|uniref:Uncharacterized protein n=1 Tax=Amorphotheca resinae ATCC 22711 TaxID=857342 RepID=A0A2T3BFD1_AMORE|nr:hypothetical protein M430DRAFT_163011 [Amorphotheca resinae ATCC 22711]PSS28092.1 hypothetical protein M430DRAFT_163011 [Amorphotheca resinae ATCC 22711]